MRRITIEFEVPEESEPDYDDVDAELVVEDFLKPEVDYTIISDNKKV